VPARAERSWTRGATGMATDGGKQPHILNASSNLIGICFVIIAGLKITDLADQTLVDEVCIVAAFGFLCACVLSYVSIRIDDQNGRYERVADHLFLSSLILLFVGVVLFARNVL
jgi:hypothetical protein